MQRVLSFCKIAAAVACLMPLAVWAKGGKESTSSSQGKRLVLFPQAHVQVPAEPIWGDSAEAVVTVAVPDSCKNQRYVCRFEMNGPLRLATVPRYKWALQRDSLKVLSSIPLQIRIAHRTLASSPQPLVLKIHFLNLDHAAKLSGIASLTIIPDGSVAPKPPVRADSAAVAISPLDSTRAAPAQAAASPAVADSTATTGSSSFSGMVYLLLAVVLISAFGGLSWLMSWSQRRRFQKFEAKSTAATFPHLQHMQPQVPAAVEEELKTAQQETAQRSSADEHRETVVEDSSATNLPATISNGNQSDLTMVLTQLHELNLSLRQVLANQNEANERLAQITAAALQPPQLAARVALFDFLNEEADAQPGNGLAGNSGSSPHLRIQLAGENGPDGVSVNVTPSTPVQIEVANLHHHDERVSFSLGTSSKLRILFANMDDPAAAEPLSNGHQVALETPDQVLLH
jgi:hypothetical protein